MALRQIYHRHDASLHSSSSRFVGAPIPRLFKLPPALPLPRPPRCELGGGGESEEERRKDADKGRRKEGVTLDDVNPVGLGRRSRQIFDEVWRKFSGLGQISRSRTEEDDSILLIRGPMCEFTVPEAQDTTVLVVGATSRIGRIVVRKLMLRGYKVKALVRKADPEVINMLPRSVSIIVGDVGEPSTLQAAVQGCNKIIYCATARSTITGDLNRVDYQGVCNVTKAFQDYSNQLAQMRAGKSNKSKLLLAKFKSADSLEGWEVRKGAYFQDVVAAKYDGGMDAKFEFTETGNAIFSGYVFTRGGYVELSKKISLPLGSTLDRYDGLVLSVGGNGRSYIMILETGPLADTSQSKLYFARINTKVGFCRVRVPFSSFRPVKPDDPLLDPFLVHTLTIRFEPRRQRSVEAPVNKQQDPRSFKLIMEYIKALPTGTETDFILVSCTGSGIESNRRDQVLKAKKAGEDALRRSGLGYTIIRPGPLKAISCADVADICVKALHDSTARNKSFDVCYEFVAEHGNELYELVRIKPSVQTAMAGKHCRRLGDGDRHASAHLLAAPPTPIFPEDPEGLHRSGFVGRLDVDGEFGRRVSQIISDDDLRDLIISLDENLERDDRWEHVIEKNNDLVSYKAICYRPKEGPLKYHSVTTFANCTTELLRDFYMDNEYRKVWDKILIQHKQLQVDENSGMEIGCSVKKFPLLTPREYVLAWRIWEGKDKTFYCLIKDCEHPLAPHQKKYVRVHFYKSGWCIRKGKDLLGGNVSLSSLYEITLGTQRRPKTAISYFQLALEFNYLYSVDVPGRDACEITVVHQEDSGLNAEMAKLTFAKGIWSFVCKTNSALREYPSHPSRAVFVPALLRLIKKVPSDFEADIQTSTHEITENSSNDHGRQSKVDVPDKKPISATTKWIANGLLIVGGILFLSRGRTTIATQLAAVCMLNKFMHRGELDQVDHNRFRPYKRKVRHIGLVSLIVDEASGA
ncbi:hypothetical protein ZIOFF_043120 [Zingiber officinale]|uniref:START domain-containing protein n=1 Tax=Zingiber officinale TaxID=94328 RepID=A0A8J5KZC0_ZINOF|nr:hypothetical protein ZIOFF_043120 [Zingiber officinale]